MYPNGVCGDSDIYPSICNSPPFVGKWYLKKISKDSPVYERISSIVNRSNLSSSNLCYEISKSNKAQKIFGIDISKKRIEHAEKYYNERKNTENLSEVIFTVDDLNYCNLNEDYYKFVFTWDTLHHIVNLDHLLQETNKSLKKDGYFLAFDHIGKRGV